MNEEEALKKLDHTLEELETLRDKVDELDDVVQGDQRRGINGMINDMKDVRAFMETWNKREYMVRGIVLLLSSNIVLGILGLALQLVSQ